MIRLVEALNYRCLRYLSRPLDPFQILVGPNASGKTTFLDVIAFLGRLVGDGLDAAIEERSLNFDDLIWDRKGDSFELAVEAEVPESRRHSVEAAAVDTIRYEIKIAVSAETREAAIISERVLLLKGASRQTQVQPQLFPAEQTPPETLATPKKAGASRTVLSKKSGGNDNWYSEVLKESGKGWFPSVRLGPRKSTLGNLPDDESNFPVATWFRELLISGVQNLMLNSLLLRRASPPGQKRGLKPDGSNLPWVITELEQPDHRETMRDWISHIQTALPDIASIRTIERPEDRHRYLMIRYKSGLEIPSWMASDGTLRLLALTLPAYLPSFKGIYLIEEPENGIHPSAVETVFHSLSSVYNAQILVATHSPVLLKLAKPGQVLCFKKADSGATDVVRGDQHPALRDWHGLPNLDVMFASGVLG